MAKKNALSALTDYYLREAERRKEAQTQFAANAREPDAIIAIEDDDHGVWNTPDGVVMIPKNKNGEWAISHCKQYSHEFIRALADVLAKPAWDIVKGDA